MVEDVVNEVDGVNIIGFIVRIVGNLEGVVVFFKLFFDGFNFFWVEWVFRLVND